MHPYVIIHSFIHSFIRSFILQTLTTAWVERDISNFEYLMQLNCIAGRTRNDLGQYPIFPWVLRDYESPQLDLRNSDSFRDLSWPVGAQDEAQRDATNSKYLDLAESYEACNQSGEEGAIALPPFHWGSHYSVAGFVLWYLVRLEPFTSLHVQLQDGKIDKADRLFSSIAATWRGVTTNPSDVS